MRYRTKLTLTLVGTAIAVNVISIAVFFQVSHQSLRREFDEKVASIASTAAAFLDGDTLKTIKTLEDESGPAYLRTRNELRHVRDANRREGTYVKFIYVLARVPGHPDSLQFLVDAEEDPAEVSHVGEVYHYKGDRIRVNTLQVDTQFSTDQWGTWLSAYAPVKDSGGDVVGTVGVDILASQVEADLRPLLWTSLLSVLISSLLALAAAVYLSGRVTRSLRTLESAVSKIGRGDLNISAAVDSKDEFAEMAEAVNGMVAGLRERETVKGAFAKYVSRQVMDSIVAAGTVPVVHGDRRKITVLFSDIRGFTTLSESMRPEDVVLLLNDYFKRMVTIIFRNKGTLDKFIGDGLMAIFGAPVDDINQEEHAVRAAIEMQEELRNLRRDWENRGRPAIRIGIGINSGAAIVGNIGSEERMEYTAIGDTVNLASRLESATKDLGVDILVSEYTFNNIRGMFPVKRIGAIKVKGRSEEVMTYAVQVPDEQSAAAAPGGLEVVA